MARWKKTALDASLTSRAPRSSTKEAARAATRYSGSCTPPWCATRASITGRPPRVSPARCSTRALRCGMPRLSSRPARGGSPGGRAIARRCGGARPPPRCRSDEAAPLRRPASTAAPDPRRARDPQLPPCFRPWPSASRSGPSRWRIRIARTAASRPRASRSSAFDNGRAGRAARERPRGASFRGGRIPSSCIGPRRSSGGSRRPAPNARPPGSWRTRTTSLRRPWRRGLRCGSTSTTSTPRSGVAIGAAGNVGAAARLRSRAGRRASGASRRPSPAGRRASRACPSATARR